jgi:peptidoglycan/xylan/chitin deacetylase (PgdA/CDA1 family)
LHATILWHSGKILDIQWCNSSDRIRDKKNFMAYRHAAIASLYYVFKGVKEVRRSLGFSHANSLRVLLYHDIAPDDESRFAAQLRWLSQSWIFVSPERFAAMISGNEPVLGRNLLVTFDDGFASNRRVAERVLKPMGISALFFVVSDFVSQVGRDDARYFIAQHIRPGCNVDELPAHLYNMSWCDLEALLEQGHSIGGHTRSHARLSQIDAEADLEAEIIASADTLARRLGVSIEHFAYTFGDLASFSPAALAVARRRFRLVYSGLRGDNAKHVSPFALRRDAVTAQDSNALLGGLSEGAADFFYTRSCARLDRWVHVH